MIMEHGLSEHLLWVAFCLWLFCFWVASWYLPYKVALVVAAIRVALPFAYVAGLFERAWFLSDDIYYFENGLTLLQAGYNPITALTTPDGYGLLRDLARGSHILY